MPNYMRTPTHPGEHIAIELEELGMSATQLAKQLGIPANRITEIIRGRRSVTADTALRLSAWLGTTPEFWMNLQSNFDLRTAQIERGEEIRQTVHHYTDAA
jgi:addiction module HigA family antidote